MATTNFLPQGEISAAHQTPRGSPKRKRGPDSPTISTAATGYSILESDLYTTEVSSPSTKVAGKFRKLTIGHHDPGRDDEVQDIGLAGVDPPKKGGMALKDISPTPPPVNDHPDNTTSMSLPGSDDATVASVDAQSRPKSPNLSGQINPFYWQDSEITGHDPDDPEDDLYGINGIGFKPTPAIAHQRSQQRKKQLSEYRNREAREARQKRSERRRTGLIERSSNAKEASDQTDRTRVRFEDG